MTIRLVLIETMPRYLRASHEAAGNAGCYPHNGAVRAVTTTVAADALVAGDPWSRVVRDATVDDVASYPRVEEPEHLL